MGDDFPFLDETQRIDFPGHNDCPAEAPLAMGGNLSPGMLLSAYEQGVFPWFSPGEPIYWWNPDPRFVLFPSELHVPSRFARTMKKLDFSFTFDRSFRAVMENCSKIPRPEQDGTWITEEMIEGYCELHNLGYAHSIEVWSASCAGEYTRGTAGSDRAVDSSNPGPELVGGLYGISLGSCFFGESMFSLASGASRAAFILMVKTLEKAGFSIIDCQMETPHLKALGGRNVSRKEYMRLLEQGLRAATVRGSWDGRFDLG